MPVVKPARHPVARVAQLTLGGVLIVGAGVMGPLPGPGGVFLFAGGMILILRNSHRAKLKWARLKRRWPRTGHMVDRVMRRQSALRRHARKKAAAMPPLNARARRNAAAANAAANRAAVD